MTNKRELCVTEDMYAYDATEIDNNNILDGYDTVNDIITYQESVYAD